MQSLPFGNRVFAETTIQSNQQPISIPIGEDGSELSWDPKSKVLAVKASAKGLNQEFPPLTIKQSWSWAQDHSLQVKKVEHDIKKREILLQYPENGTYGDDRSDKIALEMAKKMKDVAIDQMELLLKQTYHDIPLKENDVKLTSMSYGIASKEEEIASAKYQKGLISREEKDRYTARKKSAWESLQSSELELQKAKIKLNTIMGKPKDTRFQLVDQVKDTKLNVEKEGLDAHFQSLEAKNPYLWQAKKQLEWEKEKDYKGSYELKKIAIENAETHLSTKQKEFLDTMQSIQRNLTQMEEQYQKTEAQLHAAKEELRIQIIKYERGWITLLDVMKKQLEVEQGKKTLFELAIKHEQERLKWEKPWL